MNILEVFTELADTICEHLDIKIRYSVQAQDAHGRWFDLNQTWDGAKKIPHSITRTIADARHWKQRYDTAAARHGYGMKTRIVRQITQFDVVE